MALRVWEGLGLVRRRRSVVSCDAKPIPLRSRRRWKSPVELYNETEIETDGGQEERTDRRYLIDRPLFPLLQFLCDGANTPVHSPFYISVTFQDSRVGIRNTHHTSHSGVSVPSL